MTREWNQNGQWYKPLFRENIRICLYFRPNILDTEIQWVFSAKRRVFILNYFVLFIWSEQYCDVANILCKSVTIHHTQTNEAFAWGYLLQKQKWESILSRKLYRFSLNFFCECVHAYKPVNLFNTYDLFGVNVFIWK